MANQFGMFPIGTRGWAKIYSDPRTFVEPSHDGWIYANARSYNNPDDDVIKKLIGENIVFSKLVAEGGIVSPIGAALLTGAIHTLELSGNSIRNQGAILLSKNLSIINLDLSFNKLDGGCVKSFDNGVIEKLILSGNSIGDEGVKILAKNRSLVAIGLALSKITNKSVDMLSENKKITCLDLSNNCLEHTSLSRLALSNLTYLDISDNFISAGICEISRSTTITALNASNNYLSTRGLMDLARNTTLRILNISDNMSTYSGILALVNNITLISLSAWNFGDLTPFVKNNTLMELFGDEFDTKLLNTNRTLISLTSQRFEYNRPNIRKLLNTWKNIAVLVGFIRANLSSPLSHYVMWNLELIKELTVFNI